MPHYFVIPEKASMRRSRRKGHSRRTCSDAARVALDNESLFTILRGFRQNLAERIGHEGARPRIQARSGAALRTLPG